VSAFESDDSDGFLVYLLDLSNPSAVLLLLNLGGLAVSIKYLCMESVVYVFQHQVSNERKKCTDQLQGGHSLAILL
jgi:hypothetical protein